MSDSKENLAALKLDPEQQATVQFILTQKNVRIAELQTELDQVYASKSWKLTFPLRKLAYLARYLVGKQEKCGWFSALAVHILSFPATFVYYEDLGAWWLAFKAKSGFTAMVLDDFMMVCRKFKTNKLLTVLISCPLLLASLIKACGGIIPAIYVIYQAFRSPNWRVFLKFNLSRHNEYARYDAWISRFDTLTKKHVQDILEEIKGFSRYPTISILMPVYNPQPEIFQEAIDSIKNQIYPHWELCIADDNSTDPQVRSILECEQADSRVKVEFRTENGHISASSNTALELVTGEYTALMDHDDLLPQHALYYVAKAILEHPEADIFYSDEDKVMPSEVGDPKKLSRYQPFFKPEWNEVLLLSFNYISHLGTYRTSLLRQVGGFRLGFEGSQDYDLILRCVLASSPEKIRHIPQILYHWRQFAGSGSFSDTQLNRCSELGRQAVQEYLQAKNIPATVVATAYWTNRTTYYLPNPLPLVSCIIPTRNQAALTRQVVEGLLHETDYDNLEIIVVNNSSTEADALALFAEIAQNSKVRVLDWDAPFNYSAINNFAVGEAKGEILALLNNDIKVIEPNWLKEMVSYALQSKVGAVGAKLLYSNDTIQHAGTVCGLWGVAGHGHLGYPKDEPGYFNYIRTARWVSAVTAACLVVEKAKYLAVGGFNELNLKVAFNDVDFCLKLLQAKYVNIYTPFAELYHLESVSRGREDTPEKLERFNSEIEYMKNTWPKLLYQDAYYSPHLTRNAGNYDIICAQQKPAL